MENFVGVCSTGELGPGCCKVVSAGGYQIALFNVNGTFYATDNTCAHRGGPLGEGKLDGAVVTCPWHAWSYDVTTGVCVANPNVSVKKYPVRIHGDEVQVAVSSYSV